MSHRRVARSFFLALVWITACEPVVEEVGYIEKIVLRAAHSTNIDEPYHQGLLEMARIAHEQSNGRIEIKIYPSMQLGGEKAMLEGLLLGAVDIVVTANGPVTNFVPQMGILDLPFLFDSREHM